MHNPVDKCFKWLSAKHCVVQVFWALDWLRELDQCLEVERSTYKTCRLLLQFSPVSSLRSSNRSIVKHSGQGEAASETVEFCLRALEDFDLTLHESSSNGSASIEAMRSKIIDIIEALDNILQIVPLKLMPKGRMLGDASDQKRGKTIHETCEKPSREGVVVSGRRWFLSLICWLLILIVLLCNLPREIARYLNPIVLIWDHCSL
ncbi:uncharacterized protein [Triticum aestivum]|uniref:uncharacterized protein n=1 Tax=Triticum aestivum TaxID=4565 RepID=UPI001D003D19|nr:uncharacterized protein LOC123064675 [Triticum aestivum]